MTQHKSYRPNAGRGPLDPMSEALTPKNIPAEMAVISDVLAYNRHYDKVNEILTEDHFYDPVLRRTWGWIDRSMQSKVPANLQQLERKLLEQTKLDPMSPDFLAPEKAQEYIDGLSVSLNVTSMPDLVVGNAQLVRNASILRAAFEVSAELAREASAATSDRDPTEIILAAQSKLSKVEATGATTKDKTLKQAMAGALAVIRAAQAGDIGIPTGLLSLDRRIGGLRKKALYIIAGRPGAGKSILGAQIARNAANQCLKDKLDGKDRYGVALFISYEMDAEQIALRFMADMANMPIDKQLEQISELLHERRMRDLIDVAEDLGELPMIINDDAPTTISGLTSYVKRIHRETPGGVRVLVIDYLQLMGGIGASANTIREQVVAEISRGLKALARDLDIPVVALSQLSRAVEQRDDKRPKLSDIRESGSIEQDADCVMFCYREAYYLENSEPEDPEEYTEWLARMDQVRDEADIIVAKLRQGKTGTVKQKFSGEFFNFSELDIKAS